MLYIFNKKINLIFFSNCTNLKVYNIFLLVISNKLLLFVEQEPIEQQVEEIIMDDDFDLDMDFSKTKKKKKKKKDLDELVAEEERKEIEDKENGMYHKK